MTEALQGQLMDTFRLAEETQVDQEKNEETNTRLDGT
jgi:hypothetical protein